MSEHTPAGFVPEYDQTGEIADYVGPSVSRPEFNILTSWDPESGHLFFIDHKRDDPFTAAEVRELLEILPGLLGRLEA